MVKGLYVTRKKAQKGQVKVRFEVNPFKFVTGKYCLKYTWRANSLPPLPPPSLQNIETLKRATLLEAPTMVSQTRLKNRTFEPNVELCQDRALYRLIEEVFEISTNTEWLREKLKMLKWKQTVFLLTETIVMSYANRSIMYLIERAILGDILPQFQDIEIHHVLHMFSSWVN